MVVATGGVETTGLAEVVSGAVGALEDATEATAEPGTQFGDLVEGGLRYTRLNY